jgi:hypothetical protein
MVAGLPVGVFFMARRKYIEYYEKYYNIKIPEGFIIHHIDSDRTNNNIDNLIMLPSKLHSKYHSYMNLFNSENISLTMQSLQKTNVITNLAITIQECGEWIIKKYNMDYKKFMEANNGINKQNQEQD